MQTDIEKYPQTVVNSTERKKNWYLAFPTLWEGPCHWYSQEDVCEAQQDAPGVQDEISLREIKEKQKDTIQGEDFFLTPNQVVSNTQW